MDFSLSNSLVGSATLNPDKLSLDLQFAADKTLTARKGPTPTFTRASGATFVNNLGQVKYARENLYQLSQSFTDVSWNKNNITLTSGISDPLGGSNAFKLTENTVNSSHTLGLAVTPTAIPHTMSIYAKKGERNWIVLRLGAVNTSFNLDTGTFIASANPAAISNEGNGWYRCSVTSSAGTQGSYRMSPDGVTDSYTGDGTSGVFLFGAQLERHEFARAYIPTTTSAVYQPRFDHDPVTLASRGLLIEESRTNVGLQSESFDSSTWDLGAQRNLTIAADNIASPSGLTNADRLTVGATTTIYQVIQATPTLTSGTVYTVSCFFKANQVTRVAIYATTTATLPVSAIFELSGSGTVVQTSFGTASIQQYSNGWYRCIITGTAGASVPTSVRISPVTGTSTTYTGNSVDSFYAWGYQLEVGSFPTSYIPTTTASVVRSADVCSITGSAFTGFYNQSEGTVLTDSIPAVVAGTTTVFGLSNGTANERWLNRFAQNEQVIITSAGTESTMDSLNPVAGQRYKVVVTGKVNDFAMSINGLTAVTDTSQPMPVVDRAGIGTPNGVAAAGVSTIASIRYYKKRLSNAKIQTLTA